MKKENLPIKWEYDAGNKIVIFRKCPHGFKKGNDVLYSKYKIETIYKKHVDK